MSGYAFVHSNRSMSKRHCPQRTRGDALSPSTMRLIVGFVYATYSTTLALLIVYTCSTCNGAAFSEVID
jgi:hypothetical protein